MPRSFRILGPVEVAEDGRPVPVAGGRQRALLALLLVNAPHPVSADRIADALWDGVPPSDAKRNVQVLVSRLRRELGDVVATRAPGYALDPAGADLDRDRFLALREEGRAALAASDAATAAARLRAALEVWRGPALADARDGGELAAAADRLDALRVDTLEDRIEADLALGATPLGELEELIAAHPHRERLRAQQMLVLYRSGRQADALAAYRDARRTLADDLGLEPGPELRALEARILAHDPALQPPPTRTVVAAGRSRSALVAVALAAAALVAIVVLAGGHRHHGKPPLLGRPDSVIEIDPADDRVVGVIGVGRKPDSIAGGPDGLWVANYRDRTVSHILSDSRRVVTMGGLPQVDNVAVDPRGGVWVSAFDHPVVARLTDRDTVRRRLRVRSHAEGLAIGGGYLWVTNPAPPAHLLAGDSVTAVDLRTARVASVFPVGTTPIFDAFGYGSAWIANYDEESVSVIRPGSSRPTTIALTGKPLGVATGAGGVWVVDYTHRRVVRIDPVTRRVVARIGIGEDPLQVAVGEGAVWATNRSDGTVSRIDPRTNRVVATIRVGRSPAAGSGAGVAPYGVTVSAGRVWVTADRCDAPPCTA